MNKNYVDPNRYAKHTLNDILLTIRKYSRLYYTLTIIISFMASFSGIMTSIMISKMIWHQQVDWFYIMTTGISATTAFITSILNFFMIKEKLESNKKLWHKVEAEIVKHDLGVGVYLNKENADWNLFVIVSQLTDNVAAKKEPIING